VNVVDESVVVVVLAVAGNLLGIHPEVRAQVGVQRVDAVVDDRDDHRLLRRFSGEELAHSALRADARHTIGGFVE
jgi:hypothetical protein